ncbi:MAG: NADH-quinone oxidoreductase subunit NuoF [Deltaproteobacteria bacterium]|nr:NADH-quinone oxidoreductase subunit NuoF [Deltaproteobacteria bacterium]
MELDYKPILLPNPGRTTAVTLKEYEARGGYVGLRKSLALKPEEVTTCVKDAGLKGRGGAGFPTGLKWSFVPKGPGPKYMVVNADESEPGTFKDRDLMEIEPHTLLEGIAIGSYAIGCELAFVYIRGEYTVAGDRLRAAFNEAKAAGLLGSSQLKKADGSPFVLDVIVFLGAGAYICGEETALIESLEGNRPMPRSRPPFPAVAGLYMKPTVVNNVETLCNVPFIMEKGVDAYKAIGNPPNNTGPKIFCLSGHVKKPGNYEVPLGKVTLRQLIEDFGGGTPSGLPVKGVLPAGVSAPIIPALHLDALLDYDGIKATGSMLGSASFIVMDSSVDMAWAATRMVEFFRHESCGKCTPCREGTLWLEKTLFRIMDGGGKEGDLETLQFVSKQIAGNVLCALGDFATSPVMSSIKYFPEDYTKRLVKIGRKTDKTARAAE